MASACAQNTASHPTSANEKKIDKADLPRAAAVLVRA